MNLRTAFEVTLKQLLQFIFSHAHNASSKKFKSEKEQMTDLTFILPISGSKSRHAIHCVLRVVLRMFSRIRRHYLNTLETSIQIQREFISIVSSSFISLLLSFVPLSRYLPPLKQ